MLLSLFVGPLDCLGDRKECLDTGR